MNQVHYIDKQFSLYFLPISLQVVNNFTIWYPCSQFYKINFMNCITWFHKERSIVYKFLLIAPHNYLCQNFDWPLLSNLGPMSIVIACTSSICDLTMLNEFGDHSVQHGFWCVQIPIEKWTMWWQTKLDVSNIFKSLVYSTRFVKWDIMHEDEPLSIKAENYLGLKEFEELVYIVGTKCNICGMTPSWPIATTKDEI